MDDKKSKEISKQLNGFVEKESNLTPEFVCNLNNSYVLYKKCDEPNQLEKACEDKQKQLGAYVIVLDDFSGDFVGYMSSRNGREIVLEKARNIIQVKNFYDLAKDGAKSKDCSFSCEVEKVIVFMATEVIFVSEKAKKTILEFPEPRTETES